MFPGQCCKKGLGSLQCSKQQYFGRCLRMSNSIDTVKAQPEDERSSECTINVLSNKVLPQNLNQTGWSHKCLNMLGLKAEWVWCNLKEKHMKLQKHCFHMCVFGHSLFITPSETSGDDTLHSLWLLKKVTQSALEHRRRTGIGKSNTHTQSAQYKKSLVSLYSLPRLSLCCYISFFSSLVMCGWLLLSVLALMAGL